MDEIETFHLTSHALKRCAERGLTAEMMRNVVTYHERKRQTMRGDHGGFVSKFYKAFPGKTVVVVAETKKKECWLLTGYYL